MYTNHPSPLVSVIITTYNRAGLVGRAVESVLGQNYPNLEVVVVDDGSTDGTAQVLQHYETDSRVRIIRHPQNHGVTAAKNTGLEKVQGVYTTMVDSDDELLPEAIETLVGLLERLGQNYGMVFANCFDPESGELTGYGLMQSGDVTYKDAICARFSGEFWGIWRTSALGQLRFDERVPGHESLVWHQIYRNCKVYYLHKPLRKYYREGPDRISQAVFDPKRSARTALGYQLYISEFGSDIKIYCPNLLARLYQIMAFWFLLAGNRIKALRTLGKAFITAPGLLSALLVGSVLVPRGVLWTVITRRRAR